MTGGIRERLRSVVFGETLLPQEFTIGMSDPESEVQVWLNGWGEPIDVTGRQTTACSEPFLIAIGFDEGDSPGGRDLNRLQLEFRERAGDRRLLGRIGLAFHSSASVDRLRVIFFRARSARNFCLPRLRLGAHYLLQAWNDWRAPGTSGMHMTFLERRAAIITFIRAHPVYLVTAGDERGGNIFPMNIAGGLGAGRAGFALKQNRTAAPLVERTRRLALNTLPTRCAPLVFLYAAHHFREAIDWSQLPFGLRRSQTQGIPVPEFALRTRELEVESILRNGSHTFFVARILSEQRWAGEEELCAIHGFYQAWRLRGDSLRLRASLERHRLQRSGPVPSFAQGGPPGDAIEPPASSRL